MQALKVYSLVMGGGVAAVIVLATVWTRSHRKDDDQQERERCERIDASGRITDGTVIDVQELEDASGRQSQLVVYSYDVAGVQYECSQDVTRLRHLVDVQSCKLGLQANIKYDPQNPGNSIVVSHRWNGLRR